MNHIHSETAYRQIGKGFLYWLTIYTNFLTKHEQRKGHQHHVRGTIVEEKFKLFFRAVGRCGHVTETEERDTETYDKHRDSPSQCFCQAPFCVAEIMSQQQITVESGKHIEHIKLVPGTGTPDVRPYKFPVIRNKKRHTPGHKEPPLCFPAGFFHPGGKYRHVQIQPDKQINVPHMHVQQREIERHLCNVSQRYIERLAHHFLTRIREKIENNFRSYSQQACNPREKIVNDRPDKERPEHTPDAFTVERSHLSFYRKQQSTCNHHNQRHTRTKQRAVHGTPPLDFRNIGRRFSRIEVKRVCRMAAYYSEHGYQTNHVEPHDVCFLSRI